LTPGVLRVIQLRRQRQRLHPITPFSDSTATDFSGDSGDFKAVLRAVMLRPTNVLAVVFFEAYGDIL
jgi:hypothetical protein